MNFSKNRKYYFVSAFLALAILIFFSFFSKSLLIKSVDKILRSRGVEASRIAFRFPLFFTLKDVKFTEANRFEGGYAEEISFALSLPDPGKIKFLSVEDFRIPFASRMKTGESGDISVSGRNIPDEIRLKNGIIEFSGREIIVDSFSVKTQEDSLTGYFSSSGSFCTINLRDSSGVYLLSARSKDTIKISEYMNLSGFSLKAEITSGSIKGSVRGNFSTSFFGGIETTLEDKIEIDFSASPAVFSLPNRGVRVSTSEDCLMISADSFFSPIKPHEKFEIISYSVSGNLRFCIKEGLFLVDADSLKVSNLRVHSRFICRDTVTFSSLNIPLARLSISFDDSLVEIDTFVFALDNSDVSINGFVDYSDSVRLRISFCGEKISVEDIINFVPDELLPNLSGISGRGDFDVSGYFYYVSCFPESTDFGIGSVFRGVSIDHFGPKIDMDTFSRPFVATVRIGSSKGEKIALGIHNPNFVPIENLPQSLIGAVLVCEDGSFFSHRGFSLFHIRRAMRENLSAGRYISGGSTITMQLARNLFLSDERSLSRKLEEAVLTWQLEKHLSKKRILEIYLNIIEFGPGIRGVQEASKEYFGTDASNLDPLQSAYFASIIPNPRRYYQIQFERGSISPYWHQKLVRIMELELARNYIDSTAFDSFSAIDLEFIDR
ncbi:transglycosylase domain-containing protein [candidate division WOR-3 bacterium]|nr:transglycosylase domain-containing protein [candidate division WOR-3 bacterium]